ncbi:DUF3068 domain-containing protein [Rhodococcus sp. WS4]|nr:DUF3068 domain-containing protein [Rhodococcus sp. WS4]
MTLEPHESHEGIVFSWPMKPSQDTTELYDSVTRSGQPAEFVGEDEVAGRNVYNFKVDASGPIQSLTVLAQFAEFPKQLPKSVVQGLLQAGTVPSDSTAVLEANLATMPNVLDIGFGSSNVVDVAVDTQFGAPLKVNQTQSMYVTVSVNGEDVPVPSAVHGKDAHRRRRSGSRGGEVVDQRADVHDDRNCTPVRPAIPRDRPSGTCRFVVAQA